MGKSLEEAAKLLFDHLTETGKLGWLSVVTYDETSIVVGIRTRPNIDIPVTWEGYPVRLEGGMELKEYLSGNSQSR